MKTAEPAPGKDAGSPISVESVEAEYAYLQAHPCECGGEWDVGQQSLLDSPGTYFLDKLEVRCRHCSSESSFFFREEDEAERQAIEDAWFAFRLRKLEEAEASSEAAPVPVSAPVAPALTTAVIQNAKLTIVRGGTVGKVFPLQPGDNWLGRWDPNSGAFPEVDLETDDPEAYISRKHALIRVGEQVTIEDIRSFNGTYVNWGRRLEPGSPVVLKDSDEIIVARKILFKISLA